MTPRETAKPAETRDQVLRIARFTADAIGLGREIRDDEVILDERYHAGTYGISDESTLSAMRLAARLEAMITDPVYGTPMEREPPGGRQSLAIGARSPGVRS